MAPLLYLLVSILRGGQCISLVIMLWLIGWAIGFHIEWFQAYNRTGPTLDDEGFK